MDVRRIPGRGGMWTAVLAGAGAAVAGATVARDRVRALVGAPTVPLPQSRDQAVTIARPPTEVEAFCADLARLGAVVSDLEHRTVEDGRRLRGRVRGADGEVRCALEIAVREQGGLTVTWWADETAGPDGEAEVRFLPSPGDRGTEVHVRVRDAEVGDAARVVAVADEGTADQRIREDLRRVKQVLEAGEVVELGTPPAARDRGQEQVTERARQLLRTGARP